MIAKRAKVLLLLFVLILSTTFSAAEPGGNGDGLRDMQCGGACHGDASQNASSLLTLSIEFPEYVWVGQPTEVTVEIGGVNAAHDEHLIGIFLLSSTNANGDTPLDDGWEILSDGQGGSGNYVEMPTTSNQATIEQTWVLRADDVGTKTLYASVHHGDSSGPSEGRPFFGVSQGFDVSIDPVPENLARLHEDFTPVTTREVGDDLSMIVHTTYADAVEIEWRTEDGAVMQAVVNSTAPDYWQFTLPATLTPSIIEWRAILSGEGPSQTTPWFVLGSQITPETVNEMPIYLQGFAMGLLLFGAVLLLQKQSTHPDEGMKIYDETSTVESTESDQASEQTPQSVAPLPEDGLPPGWTEEQWEWYGHEYLAGTYGGEGQ